MTKTKRVGVPHTQAAKSKIGKTMRANWADPAFRRKAVEAQKASWRRRRIERAAGLSTVDSKEAS